MDLNKFKTELFGAAGKAGFEEWEIYGVTGNQFEVKIFKGEIEQYKNACTQGISFRGKFAGKMGYAYSEKIDTDVIPQLLRQAKTNSTIMDKGIKEKLYPGSKVYMEDIKPDIHPTPVEEKINLAKEMEKRAYEKDKRVVSVDYCIVAEGTGQLLLANSLGLDLHEDSHIAVAYVGPRVEENGQTKVAIEIYKGHDFANCNPVVLAEKAVEKAIANLGAHSVPTGQYPVIFDKMVAADLLAAFAPAFFAKNVQKGFSLLKNKLNKEIGNINLSIRDDGVIPQGLGNNVFDGEGVATSNKWVVEKGYLKTYLYNLETAEEDNVDSTGNGFRGSFKGAVDTACNNFYIVPGSCSLENMMKEMNSGLYITEISGLHAGVNQISGDFSLSAEGFLIEKGSIGGPVDQITIAGNFFELLKQVQNVGNDLYFNIPSSMGTIGSPSMMIQSMNVAGD